LIVVLQLLAAELVCLPIIKDRRSRLSFPSLELHEATRPWTLIFRHAGKPAGHTIWHLDEVYLKIAGRMAYLWRAVDSEGEVLDVLVQSRRNKRAALKLIRKLLKKYALSQTSWSRMI
jgi:hypothetical protein